MGIMNALFGRTGPGKLAAAKNALVAKHMYLSLGEEERRAIGDKVSELLVAGGIPLSGLLPFLTSMSEDAFYGMIAMAFSCFGMNPTMPNLFPRGEWNRVDNPLVALAGAQDEIVMARGEIKRKYNISIDMTV